VFYIIIGALDIQLATPKIVQWLQEVIWQLEDNNVGYDSDEDDVATAPAAPASPHIVAGCFSISAFNEHVQRERHTVTYSTQSSGLAHVLTWVSSCTGKPQLSYLHITDRSISKWKYHWAWHCTQEISL
jgi:hypothetical protein